MTNKVLWIWIRLLSFIYFWINYKSHREVHLLNLTEVSLLLKRVMYFSSNLYAYISLHTADECGIYKYMLPLMRCIAFMVLWVFTITKTVTLFLPQTCCSAQKAPAYQQRATVNTRLMLCLFCIQVIDMGVFHTHRDQNKPPLFPLLIWKTRKRYKPTNTQR